MPKTPQITLLLDSAGTLHAEIAGHNGARQKLALDANNPFATIMRNLNEQAQALAAEARAVRPAPSASDSSKTFAEIQAREIALAKAKKAKREADDRAFLEGLSPGARALEETKRQRASEREAERTAARARSIWNYTANMHDIELANRVVPDAERRPSRRFTIADLPGTYSPRVYNPSGPTTGRVKKRVPTYASAIDIKLDL